MNVHRGRVSLRVATLRTLSSAQTDRDAPHVTSVMRSARYAVVPSTQDAYEIHETEEVYKNETQILSQRQGFTTLSCHTIQLPSVLVHMGASRVTRPRSAASQCSACRLV